MISPTFDAPTAGSCPIRTLSTKPTFVTHTARLPSLLTRISSGYERRGLGSAISRPMLRRYCKIAPALGFVRANPGFVILQNRSILSTKACLLRSRRSCVSHRCQMRLLFSIFRFKLPWTGSPERLLLTPWNALIVSLQHESGTGECANFCQCVT